jgi:hypothetical protein
MDAGELGISAELGIVEAGTPVELGIVEADAAAELSAIEPGVPFELDVHKWNLVGNSCSGKVNDAKSVPAGLALYLYRRKDAIHHCAINGRAGSYQVGTWTEPLENLLQLTGFKMRQAAAEPLNLPAGAVAAGLCCWEPAGWPGRGRQPITRADIHRQVVRQLADDMPAMVTGGK